MITTVFGIPGCGKSTYAAQLVKRATTTKKGLKKYKAVYSNFHILGAYPFNFQTDYGVYDFSGCLIIIDEAANECDARNYKTFDEDKKYFTTNHRHYQYISDINEKFDCDIVFISQGWDDCDKRIRNSTELIYYIRKCRFPFIFNQFSFAVPIYCIFDVDEETHQIVSGYKKGGLLSYKFIFRPLYYHMFDSFECNPLKPLELRHYKPYGGANAVAPRIGLKDFIIFLRELYA